MVESHCFSWPSGLHLSLVTGILLFSQCWTPTHEIGFFVGPNDIQEGDAPNSSVCRAALGNATDNQAKCSIAQKLRGCQFDSGFFPYMVFQYCTFQERITPTIFMILWLLLLLGAFATIADSFFSPALIALARTLRMSQNLAGVTLLAFGNGAPDVFSAVTAITTGDPDAPDEGLGLGFLLGSGLLVNTVTAGLIMVIKPFKMSRRPFLKDSLFYLCAVSWSASILIRRRINYTDAIGFLCFYLFYVLITWASGTLHSRQRKSIKPESTKHQGVVPLGKCHRFVQSMPKVFPKCAKRFMECLLPSSKKQQIDKPGELAGSTKIMSIDSNQLATQNVKIAGGGNMPISNGTAELGLMKPSICIIPPTIEITSVQTPDDSEFDQIFDSKPNLTSLVHSKSIQDLTDNQEYPMKYLACEEHQRQRSSSVGSNYMTRTSGKLADGTPGFARDRPQRSHSVSRRRASVRMGTIGAELPYMVRWIIANRGLEEKDLSANTEWKRSQKNLQFDVENEPQEAFQDSVFSFQPSRKTSRLNSTINSPTWSRSSLPEDIVPKQIQGKKITLNLIPTEPPEMQLRAEKLEEADQPIEFEVDEDLHSLEASHWVKWASRSSWHHFLYYMSPIDLEEWHNVPIISRIIQIIQIPLFMLFRLTIPTVLEDLFDEASMDDVKFDIPIQDAMGIKHNMETVIEESESVSTSEATIKKTTSNSLSSTRPEILDLDAMHGWCKILNVTQCITTPTLWPLLLTAHGKSIGLAGIKGIGLPFFVPFTIGGLLIAILVFWTSRWNKPPTLYHRPFFATLGFITSIIWIYALAHELVNSLETLGIVWEISEAILGLSIMALASSIGDIMSNCLLARNGYPRIAYSACVGSPLFNLLLGAGMSYTIKIGRGDDKYASLSFTLTQAVLFSCLMCVLICNVIVAIVFKFHFHRAYGIVLIVFYLTFVFVAILIEMDYIQSPKNWGLLTGTE